MKEQIKQSKKHNFKVFKVTDTKKFLGEYYYLVTDFVGNFIEIISNRDHLNKLNSYLSK